MRRTNLFVMMALFIFFTIEPATRAGQSEAKEPMQLGTLKPGCSLEIRPLAMTPGFEQGVWLKCRGVAFLVRTPLNLVNHVELKTPNEVLEYVRFFSVPYSYEYFDLNGMVEVLPVHEKIDVGNFGLYEPVFLKHFRPASVKFIGRGDEEVGCCRGKEYWVTRTVLMSDGKICEVEEYVCDDGFYKIQSKRVLMEARCAWRLPLSACIH